MSMPTMPRVLYSQMWRRRDVKGDSEWHPLHPWGVDYRPYVYREQPEPERVDERYEIRVVKYVGQWEGEPDAVPAALPTDVTVPARGK